MRTPSFKSNWLILVFVMLLALLTTTVSASPPRDTNQFPDNLVPIVIPTWAQLSSRSEPSLLALAKPENEQIPLSRIETASDCEPITGVDYVWEPLNPEAGEVITFSIYSFSPTTATMPITYTWDFDDSYTGTGDPVTHTYATNGSYWVFVTAMNECSGEIYMGHSVDVTGEPDISVSPVYGFSILSYADQTTTNTLTISNHPSATANLNWDLTEDPAASWVDTSITNGVVAPGDEDKITVTVDSTGLIPGTFLSTTLRITSNDPDESPWISTTVDLNVLHCSVDTVILSVTSIGTIYTDTVVSFSADIKPDNVTMPYTYTIDYGSGPTLPNVSTADPFLFPHTFAITGSHTVTFSAWNWEGAWPSSDSVSVTVSEYSRRFIYLPIVVRNL